MQAAQQDWKNKSLKLMIYLHLSTLRYDPRWFRLSSDIILIYDIADRNIQ